jgi:pimeloyl-ACP methyl ester carboxylesterase
MKEADVTLAQIIVPLRGGVVEYADAPELPLPEQPVVVDLLRLQSHAAALGLKDLPAGTAARIRLHVDDSAVAYVITSGGEQAPLEVPSGNIQIEGPFLLSGAGNVVPLQLDGEDSVWAHPTGNGPWMLRPLVLACAPEGVERSTYLLRYETSNMPDPNLDGRTAELEVRQVKPVLRDGCSAKQGVVLVHGRTIEGHSVFDTEYESFSLMESVAMAGIEAYAVNLLGYGRSSIADSPLDSACNASLPFCTGTPCVAIAGVCDCQGLPPNLLTPDQQGSSLYLKDRPLGARCAHTSRYHFQRITHQVADLDRVVDDVRQKLGPLARVSVLGFSAGGATVGNYLAAPERRAKIERAIFLSSVFTPIAAGPAEPPTPTFPLGLIDRAVALAGVHLNVACLGQVDPALADQVWSTLVSEDPIGAEWGPSGLSRFPTVSRWGWNAAAAAKIDIPTMLMVGTDDSLAPPAMSQGIFAALQPTVRKVYLELACASHASVWEGCGLDSCDGWQGPHMTVARHVVDWHLVGEVHADRGTAVIR